MLTSLPDPAPGTVRRTLSLEITPDPDWSAGLRVTAFARDLVAGAGGAAGRPGMTALRSPRDRRSPMVGICAGWAPGATADTRVRAGVPIMKGTPPARALASMTPYFHAEPAPRPRSMRRRRLLDVSSADDGYEVFEYYRDSHFDSGLREGALHEYEVRARVAHCEGDPAAGYTLERIDVVPHALPFGECPLAAPHAADLTGTPLREIAGTVKERLAGTRSCTYLNDTLRFLRYVPALAMPTLNAPNPNTPNPNTGPGNSGS
jgi:Protein of unknown function (DUF2889)